jgi:hypothetical protein
MEIASDLLERTLLEKPLAWKLLNRSGEGYFRKNEIRLNRQALSICLISICSGRFPGLMEARPLPTGDWTLSP